MSRVSVVVPCYLAGAQVQVLLASLRAQTLARTRFEVVLVLNGPEDGTATVVREHAARYPTLRTRLVRSEAAGVAAARNLGLDVARHERCTFVDHDDELSPRYLQALLDGGSGRDITVAQIHDVHEDGTVDADTPLNRHLLQRQGLRSTVGEVPKVVGFVACKLLRTSTARRTRFDEDLRSGEDVDFMVRYFRADPSPVLVLPETAGAVYRRLVRAGSLSRREPDLEFAVTERFAVVRRLLAAADEHDERTLPTLRTALSGQLGHTNRFLRGQPGRHGEVMGRASSLPLDEGHYQQLNRGLATSLVVSYCFPPFVDPSGIVAAKRLVAWGEPYDVVHSDMSTGRSSDPALAMLTRELVDTRTTVPTRTRSVFSQWAAVEAFCEKGLAAALARGTPPQGQRLYSRAMFPHSHLLAALVKLRRPGYRWVAEFSDPLLVDVRGQRRAGPVTAGTDLARELGAVLTDHGLPQTDNLFDLAELLPILLADELVYTNDSQQALMNGYREEETARLASSKALVLPQPTLPEPYYRLADPPLPERPGTAVRVGYFGGPHATRDLQDVLGCLSAHPEVTLYLVGNGWTEELARQGHEDLSNAVDVGLVGYLDSLALMSRMDVLLVSDTTPGHGTPGSPHLPSKLSDYRGSGRPVWGLVLPGSPLDVVGLEHRSRLGDASQADAVLSQLT